jgi:flagellar basal-body rod modification protein FlgD
MNLNGISSNDPIYGAASTAPAGALDKAAFLKLLVTQMQSQDPLSPSDSTQYVSQLAQFSSLEQMQNLNDNLVGMATLQQNNALLSQLTQASALIGKSVEWTDYDTGVTSTGNVTAVKLHDGLAFLEIDGHDVPLASVTTINGPPAGDTSTGTGTGGDSGGDSGGDTGA